MATRSHKIRVGLFTAATAALVALVLVVLGGLQFWRRGDTYHVIFEESVYGLDIGANVYLNGVRVGNVDEIGVSPDEPGRVRVALSLEAGTPLRTDTRAVLRYAGITGLKVIDLRQSASTAAAALPPGSMIPVGATALDRFEQQASKLAEQTSTLLERANQVVENLVELTNPDQLAGLSELVAQAKRSADHIAVASGTLTEIVRENRAPIRRLVGDSGALVGQLRGLVRDNEAALRATMFDLRQASRSVKDLARELRQRPSRLLFSDTPRDRKLP